MMSLEQVEMEFQREILTYNKCNKIHKHARSNDATTGYGFKYEDRI